MLYVDSLCLPSTEERSQDIEDEFKHFYKRENWHSNKQPKLAANITHKTPKLKIKLKWLYIKGWLGIYGDDGVDCDHHLMPMIVMMIMVIDNNNNDGCDDADDSDDADGGNDASDSDGDWWDVF